MQYRKSLLPEAKGPILFLDDDRFTREVFGDYFIANGYDVLSCASGDEATDVIRGDTPYRVALFDVLFKDCCVEVIIDPSKQRHPEVPIICISGYLKAPKGANLLLAKPVSPRYIMEVIDRWYPKEPVNTEEDPLSL